MFLALLEKIPSKFLITLLAIFILLFIGFGIGWHFCNLKNYKQYKVENNILINDINQQNTKNSSSSQEYHKNLLNYQDNVSKSYGKTDELKNSSFVDCKLPVNSLQQHRYYAEQTNKIRSP